MSTPRDFEFASEVVGGWWRASSTGNGCIKVARQVLHTGGHGAHHLPSSSASVAFTGGVAEWEAPDHLSELARRTASHSSTRTIVLMLTEPALRMACTSLQGGVRSATGQVQGHLRTPRSLAQAQHAGG